MLEEEGGNATTTYTTSIDRTSGGIDAATWNGIERLRIVKIRQWEDGKYFGKYLKNQNLKPIGNDSSAVLVILKSSVNYSYTKLLGLVLIQCYEFYL